MKLYDLTGQYLELLEMLEDGEIDQQIIKDTLEGLDFELEEKAENYAKIIKMLEGNANTIDQEIKRLQGKKQSYAGNIDSLKRNLEQSMIATGKLKFKTELFSFGIQKNPASVVIDKSVPEDYLIPQEPKIDKKAIKEFLKENSTDWAHLEQSESLRIR